MSGVGSSLSPRSLNTRTPYRKRRRRRLPYDVYNGSVLPDRVTEARRVARTPNAQIEALGVRIAVYDATIECRPQAVRIVDAAAPVYADNCLRRSYAYDRVASSSGKTSAPKVY
jgi:hypothetical protein